MQELCVEASNLTLLFGHADNRAYRVPEVVSIFDVADYDAQVSRGAKMLCAGGIVVLPTETVYGAAGMLSLPKANARLRELRGGTDAKPFTIHLADPNDAIRFIADPTDLGRRMIRKLWPGPVTLMFDVPPERRQRGCADLKVAERDMYDGSSIALRCPDHTLTTDVLGKTDGPVALTLVQSTDWTKLDDKADLVFDAGPSKYAKPSTIVHVTGESYEIVREGVYDQRIIERLLRTTILFVCSGNTCRSPMAEALTRSMLAAKMAVSEDELEKKGIIVLSAGGYAFPGARATPQAVDAVRELGGDLSRHRSRPLTVELIHQADRIFTMGRAHSAAVRALVPSASERISTLDPDKDIEDPIGGDGSLYLSLAKEFTTLIEKYVISEVMREQG
jgi:tRNA threonylcarbamoyl adenosine modification protein (Sua5/YciO/YrdC/YwlC family)